MKSFRNIAKLLIGIALFPVVMASLHAMGGEILSGLSGGSRRVWVWLLYGMGVYLVLHLFFHKFIVAYVFGKDPVRHLWGMVTGYKPPKEGDKNKKGKQGDNKKPNKPMPGSENLDRAEKKMDDAAEKLEGEEPDDATQPQDEHCRSKLVRFA